jgi:glycosyltransferase involved in cell wall biosynthesis
MIKLTIVVTVHNEGLYLGPTIKSADQAIIAYACEFGEVNRLMILDNPDISTLEYVEKCVPSEWKIITTKYGDISQVRNFAISNINTEYIAFLDGDDLFSSNWLRNAMRFYINSNLEKIILHPKINWIFDDSNYVWLMTGSDDLDFDRFRFYFSNFYDALCFAPLIAYKEIPFKHKNKNLSFGYEDWTWSMDTLFKGWKHVVVDETIIFKRRRQNSVSTLENTINSLPLTSLMHNHFIIR